MRSNAAWLSAIECTSAAYSWYCSPDTDGPSVVFERASVRRWSPSGPSCGALSRCARPRRRPPESPVSPTAGASAGAGVGGGRRTDVDRIRHDPGERGGRRSTPPRDSSAAVPGTVVVTSPCPSATLSPSSSRTSAGLGGLRHRGVDRDLGGVGDEPVPHRGGRPSVGGRHGRSSAGCGDGRRGRKTCGRRAAPQAAARRRGRRRRSRAHRASPPASARGRPASYDPRRSSNPEASPCVGGPKLPCASVAASPTTVRRRTSASQRSRLAVGRREDRGERFGRADDVAQQRCRPGAATTRRATRESALSHSMPSVVARSRATGGLGFGRIRVRDDRPAAEPVDVLDDVARFPAERIRRRPSQAERDDVARRRADLDRVDARARRARYAGGVGRARGVAVVGEDDEREPGARGRRGDLVERARAVGLRRCGRGTRRRRTVGGGAGVAARRRAAAA